MEFRNPFAHDMPANDIDTVEERIRILNDEIDELRRQRLSQPVGTDTKDDPESIAYQISLRRTTRDYLISQKDGL